MLSIVIPTYNSAATLKATLEPLQQADFVGEIILTDGGSIDETPDMARSLGLLMINHAKGRGPQLRAGANVATAQWLLFLHSDTVLAEGWQEGVYQHMQGSTDKAAYFRFCLDDPSWKARILEMLVRLRCALFALPYGDQGLLISRDHYDRIGGFQPVALMEDVSIIRQIGRKQLINLPIPAVTAATRYQKHGYFRRILKNAFCLTLHFCGVSPNRIARIYE